MAPPDANSRKTSTKHYGDWPNAAAFNALGETRVRVQLKISGIFPAYAAGTLLRTGPGGYKVARSDGKDGHVACDHWFDGFTTVHKFELVAGEGKCSEVWYSSRSHADGLIENAQKTGKLDGITFGQKRDPCESLYRKMKSTFTPSENASTTNIGVTMRPTLPQETARNGAKDGHRNLMTMTTDNHETRLFDADTLEPLGLTQQQHLNPSLIGPSSAAHPACDPNTGDIFNYNLAFGRFATYRVFRASARTGEVEILAEITDARPAYIHSLSLTENFVILCIWPAYYAKAGVNILWYRNLMEGLAPFDAKEMAIWYVVDRRHGRGVVAKFTSPAFFCFHTTNAWEERRSEGSDNVDIICELYQFSNMNILHRFYYNNLVSDESGVVAARIKFSDTPGSSGLARYKLDRIPLVKTVTGKLKPQTAERTLYIPHPDAGDLPRYNEKFALKPHRYVWSVIDRGKSSAVDGICKTDTLTQTSRLWEQERHTPGEPVFVANPAGEAEDDGVILSVIFDGDTGTSYLLCLDARNLTELGRADVGVAVGMGFHGLHIADSGANGRSD